jgi:hypothetical protein
LISFGEAANLLDKGEINLSETIASKLPPGIERAVLWLGIARAYAKENNSPRTAEALNNALASAREVADARRAFLILNAASQLARFDPFLCRLTLEDAVRELNTHKPEELTEIDWRQKVEAGSLWRHFPLKIKGIEFGFNQALPPLASIDLEGTIATVKSLRNEESQAQALIVLAATLLKPRF